MSKIVPRTILVCWLSILSATPAHALIVANAVEVNGDVIIELNGSINLAGLTRLAQNSTTNGTFNPAFPVLTFGHTNGFRTYARWSGVTSPAAFGTSRSSTGSFSSSGDRVSFRHNGQIYLHTTYVSGDPLSATNTFEDTSFADFSITAGSSYSWTWGSGADADAFVINFIDNTVPTPASWLLMTLPLLALHKREQLLTQRGMA